MSPPHKRVGVFPLPFKRRVVSGFLLLFFAVIFISGAVIYEINQPAGSGPKKEIVIGKGETVRQIATKLGENGLVRSANLFIVYVTLKGFASQIEAGRYEILPSLSMLQVIELLRHGTFDVRLTFLEGWRREEYLEYVLKYFLVDDENFAREFMTETKGLEGYLFPDTYFIVQDITASELVKILKKNFEKKYAEVAEAITAKNLSKKEAVILASLVERETINAKEAAVIAGILLKRLNSGWRLDVDASVQYALGYQTKEGTWWKKVLDKEDLKLDSPYNTYKHVGLPPGPICNPGLAALTAVKDTKPSPYWFYLHDKDGRVHYAETLEEHKQNIIKYLK